MTTGFGSRIFQLAAACVFAVGAYNLKTAHAQSQQGDTTQGGAQPAPQNPNDFTDPSASTNTAQGGTPLPNQATQGTTQQGTTDTSTDSRSVFNPALGADAGTDPAYGGAGYDLDGGSFDVGSGTDAGILPGTGGSGTGMPDGGYDILSPRN